MVDRPKCDQMLSNLRGFIRELDDLGSVRREDFLASKDKIGNAKYQFVVAIKACIDAANHIVSSEGLRIPRNNADSFAVLAENGIVATERLEAYQAMARFRNRLVHLYWDVDDGLVYDCLRDAVLDLESFASAASAFVNAGLESQGDRESEQ